MTQQTEAKKPSHLVGKISFKTVCKAPEMQPVTITAEDGVTKKVVMRGVEKQYMRVAGIVRSTAVKTSQYGDSIEFSGDFRAINIQTGEIFNGGKLFLPQIAERFAFNAFEQVSGSEGFTGLELAFDVGVKPAITPSGYEYTVSPLIEKQQPDFLDALLGSLPPLALTAPAPAENADDSESGKKKK